MKALHPNLRNNLEDSVKKARNDAERGAQATLERLAIGAVEPFSEMTPAERVLRNRLRARGRQLGDGPGAKKGEQKIDRLKTELAYEYWHQMLFARFLAENHLLLHPDGIAITLEECEELAREEGAVDGWALASRYASRMLPQIFRPDDPLLQIAFAPEHRMALEKLLADLPVDVFTADDSLGWVYQFWQAERKEQINALGNKIGADELPAVTQLFTEHYMVEFLIHNSLGAWWVARHPDDDLAREFTYLRRLEDGSPVAGTFPGWPRTARELKVLDPCCGSGHFLVGVFDLLAKMRMREEGLSARDAADAVLGDNLFGLELDPRCTQIAAFALALAAWKFAGYHPLPPLNVACSGIAPRGKKEEWLSLANGDEALRGGLEHLYDLFQQAPELGSLIDPYRASHTSLPFTASFAALQPLLDQALHSEKANLNLDLAAAGVAAQGIALAAELLAQKYHLVITNVPYLARGKHDYTLYKYCETQYSYAKADLATVFVKRCLDLCFAGGCATLVTPQNWLFLGSYKKLRIRLLKSSTLNFVVRLGPAAFQDMNWWAANTALFIITNAKPIAGHYFGGLDVSSTQITSEKPGLLISNFCSTVPQADQRRNPDARILSERTKFKGLLSKYAVSLQGISTADYPRFVRFFWEKQSLTDDWRFLQGSIEQSEFYGGRQQMIWMRSLLENSEELGAAIRGRSAWGKLGIAVRQMRHLPITLSTGEPFDTNVAVIVPREPKHLPAIWAFCSSPDFHTEVRRIDQKTNVTNATLVKVPFDLNYWQGIAEEMGPLPEPYSDDPTQWLFKGNIVGSTEPLQVAVACLLGYQWPKQQPDEFDQLSTNDGIVCIPAVRGEQPAAERLRELLAAAYGPDFFPTTIAELLTAIGYGDKTLDQWLREGFFETHCRVFHQRPFIWHIWDGRRDGFAALVNYHKLDRQQFETLIYTYLGDWIRQQEKDRENPTAIARLVAARELQKKLELILTGESSPGENPYDIFVRWKPLEKQPLGWEPDLNDGVRLNIRPFVEAGVLRKKPSIKWGKDRGKNSEGGPWGEERNNDLHLTLAQKRTAREKKAASA
jgi:Eco57I restriction-modification methylase